MSRTWPPSWAARLVPRTVRLRLTLLYGALFTASGAALLAITYLLVGNATGPRLIVHTSVYDGTARASAPSAPPVPPPSGSRRRRQGWPRPRCAAAGSSSW